MCIRDRNEKHADYARAYPGDAAELDRRLSGKRIANWDAKAPSFTKENGAVASRAAFGAVLNATADCPPELVGGSADLTPSNNTSVKAWKNFEPGDYAARYVHFGIREHGMAAIMNGMALHRGITPYGGTFLIFSDYMRPAVRLAAIMNQHVIYVYTHDSIGLGADGPTHRPTVCCEARTCWLIQPAAHRPEWSLCPPVRRSASRCARTSNWPSKEYRRAWCRCRPWSCSRRRPRNTESPFCRTASRASPSRRRIRCRGTDGWDRTASCSASRGSARARHTSGFTKSLGSRCRNCLLYTSPS